MDTLIKKEFKEIFKLQDNKEYKKAFEKLEEMVKNGFNEANEFLGHMCYKGEGINKDLDKALYYYKKVENKTPIMKDLIGSLLIELGYKEEGLDYINQALNEGLYREFVYLGYLYEFGDHSFPIDKNKALYYYTEACKKGYKDGCIRLAIIMREQNKSVYDYLQEKNMGLLKFLYSFMFGKK